MKQGYMQEFDEAQRARIPMSKRHPCMMCGKRHTTSYYGWKCWTKHINHPRFVGIRISMGTVSGEPPDKCPVCNERFEQYWSVQYVWFAHLHSLSHEEYERHILVGYLL